ncbi:MAG: hypothetical protein IPK32_17025 [Verrucomicrobiaceae bacterium]|nr:hypothetical protein [Verrucomicrobiaceae bacterium]
MASQGPFGQLFLPQPLAEDVADGCATPETKVGLKAAKEAERRLDKLWRTSRTSVWFISRVALPGLTHEIEN